MSTSNRKCGRPGCGKVGVHLCSGCGEEIYCSKECQKAHWSDHKVACKLAVKPEAAAILQSFDSLSVKQLKNLLKAKSASMEEKKRVALLAQMEKMVEKPQLLHLVKQHVQTFEIEALLTNNNVTDYEPQVPVEKVKGGRGGRGVQKVVQTKSVPTGNANPSPDQIRQQASLMRKHPDQVRKSHPMFAKMTNAQIIEYANQLEKTASDPNMMKEMEKLSKMSSKDREQLQTLQTGFTEGLASMDDKWIDKAIDILRTNPQLFKTLFLGRDTTSSQGVSDDQLAYFIDFLSGLSPWILKYLFYAIRTLSGWAPSLSQAYQTADKYTYGLAKHVLTGIVVLVFSLVLMGLGRVAMYIFRGVWSFGVHLMGNGAAASTGTSTISKVAQTVTTSTSSVVSDSVSAAAAAVSAGAAAGSLGGASTSGSSVIDSQASTAELDFEF